ncbi:RHS repeat protein [Salibacter halophilus]|uniref:RHS repeat-associated core domain-containing protein n=1 Tax=Salibacter halophilus TaxID=1803916 RepID=A0A6N6MC47_9FLAO|nr:RHS repeat protein [Salibacter halophilus]KAB1064894.1 hypothetical protein F3059_05950 [Salibacter halophilus]
MLNDKLFYKSRILLICVFTLLSVSKSFAGIEEANSRIYPDSMQVFSTHVEDSKLMYFKSTTNWEDTFYDKEVIGRVELGIDHSLLRAHHSYAETFAELEVKYETWDGTSFVSHTITSQELFVSYDPVAGTSYDDRDVLIIPGAYSIDVTLTDSTNIEDYIYLDASVEAERYEAYDIDFIPASSNMNHNKLGDKLYLSWPFIKGAEAYDVEWAYVDTVNNTAIIQHDYDFEEYSTRIRVEQNRAQIPLIYDPGYLLMRYRPVYYDSNSLKINVEGKWTTDVVSGSDNASGGLNDFITNMGPNAYYIIEDWFEASKNWSANIVYADDGYQGQQISYMDGLSRERQSLSSLNTENKVMASSQLFDAAGRPAIQILPAPVDQQKFSFIEDLNISTTGQHYNYEDFDKDNFYDTAQCQYGYNLMSSSLSNGAANYYSTDNPDKEGMQAFVPDAQGAPFLIKRYMPDRTGRLSEYGGGFGEEFQPLEMGAVEIKYGMVTNSDLGLYFNSNDHGDQQYYRSNHVFDQNNQRSYLMKDYKGRVIASMPGGEVPESLLPVDGSVAPASLEADLISLNQEQDGALVVQFQKYLPGNENFILRYDADVPQFRGCDQNVCFDCVYEVDVKVTYEDSCVSGIEHTKLHDNATIGQFSPVDNCSNDTLYEFGVTGASPPDTTFSLPYGAMVTITKTLRPSEKALEQYVDYYMQNSLCVPQFEDHFIDVLGDVASEADTCYTDPCYVECYEEYGSKEEYVNQAISDAASIEVIITYDTVYEQGGTSGEYEVFADTTYNITYPSTFDTASVRSEYDALIQECADFCLNGIELQDSRCEAVKDDLIRSFRPGGTYAMFSFDSVNNVIVAQGDSSILSSINNFGVTYRNREIKYEKSDGTLYLPGDLSPHEMSVGDFVTSFQPQWAEAIFEFVRSENELPNEAECILTACENYADVFEYDRYLRSIHTYEQATLARYAPSTDGSFLNPADVSFPFDEFVRPTNHASHMVHDPLLQESYGSDLQGFVEEWRSGEGTLYEFAAEYGDPNYQIGDNMGDDTCVMDQEWMIFKARYLAFRDSLIDAEILGSCQTMTNIPAYYGGIYIYQTLDNPQLADDLSDIDTDPDSAWDDMKSSCESNCSALADEWVNKIEQCTQNQTVIDNMRADLIALCSAGCSPENAFGTKSLPNSPHDVEVDGSVVYTVPTSIQINTGISTPTVSSFKEIFEEYADDYSSLESGTAVCNPYMFTSVDKFREEIPFSKLDTCACNTVLDIESDFNHLNNVDSLPDGVTTGRQYFAHVTGVSLPSYNPIVCNCQAAEADADPAGYLANLEIPFTSQFVCKDNCVTCDEITTHYSTFLTEVGFSQPIPDTALTDVYAVFGSYLEDETSMNVDPGEATAFMQQCEQFQNDSKLGTNGLSPQAGDMLTLIEALYDKQGLNDNSGTPLSIPLYWDFYWSTLYPYGFDTLFNVDASISGSNVSSLLIELDGTTQYPYDKEISFSSMSPADVTLDSILLFQNIYADISSLSIGNVNDFVITGITVGGRAFEWKGTCSYDLLKKIVSDGSGGYDLKICSDRYNFEPQDPCTKNILSVAFETAVNTYTQDLDSIETAFRNSYRDSCAAVNENFVLKYGTTEHSPTLYYYGLDGNLVQTVPPEGVDKGITSNNHTQRSVYQYNSINKLVSSQSPDGGTSHFYYNDKLQLVLSQNEKQANTQNPSGSGIAYSYTTYDDYGRVKEVGQLYATLSQGTVFEDLSESDQKAFLSDPGFPENITTQNGIDWTVYGKVEVTRTYYSEPLQGLTTDIFDGQNRFLRGRISTITYEEDFNEYPYIYDYALHFRYDMHGNVKELVTEDTYLEEMDQDFKRLTYEYNLLSGNVKKVTYQKGQPDQWFHKYEYDADNRLERVYTSTDNEYWEEDAHYEYYEHGPLGRQELGELKVQGLDYVYNLQGWLKSLNSNTLDKTRDPGKDGEEGSDYMSSQPDIHARFARDVFGFSLGYYDDDYAAIDASKDNFIADESSQSSNLYNLYNGNISHAVTALLDQNHEPLDVHLKRYRYDQLNRLKSQTVYTSANVIANNNWTSASTNGDYDVSLTYDENGNIMTLDRHGYGSNQDMDDLVYSYNSGTNQLDHVTENASSTPFDDYEGSSSGNYQYNEIGQLISDDEAEIADIEWNVYGKVKSITRTSGSTQPDLAFRYDPFGNRIMKVEKTKDGSGNLEDETEWIYTHYRTDASGNTMAVYETKTQNTDYLSHSVKERYLYGSNRLGVEKEEQRMRYSDIGTYNGLGDYSLDNIRHYSTGSEYLVTFSGGTITTSPNVEFHFSIKNGSDYTTVGCNTTGSIASLTSCVAGQILNPLDTIRISDTSFVVTATEFFMPTDAQISYDKVNDLKITIEEVDSPLRKQYAYHRYGKSRYELSNHLGNVQSVINNRYLFDDDKTYYQDFSTDIWSYPNSWQANGVSVNTSYGYMGVNGTGSVERPLSVTAGTGYELRFDLINAADSITVKVTEGGQEIASKTFFNGSSQRMSFTPTGSGVTLEWHTNINQSFRLDDIIVAERLESLVADIISYKDYYPGGMIMPGRNTNPSIFGYGYNGMREVDEISGTGNHYTTFYREYDPRINQWWSVDPEAISMPWQSPYVPMSRNPISRIDPLGDRDDWVEKTDENGNTKIVWDDKVTSADDKDLKEGDKYLGKEGYAIDEKTGEAVHYMKDGTKEVFTQQLPEATVKPDIVYATKNPSMSSNNRTGYIYNSADLRIRRIALSSSNPIARAILSQERRGNYQILNADDYWKEYGHTLGNMLLMDKYIGMADMLTGGGINQIRSPKSFNIPSQISSPKPKLSTPKNFSEYLKTQKGKDVGKYHGRGNWMKQKAKEYKQLKNSQ